MNLQTVPAETATTARPKRFVFVLLPDFTMLCFACAVESLRIANRMAGRTLYEWVVAGEGGISVRCSNGTGFRVAMGLGELAREDVVMVCGGLDVAAATTRTLLGWLRREARRGVTMGGLCTAAHSLARAGPPRRAPRDHPLGEPGLVRRGVR
jgi:transcriptional regulator GlxA family with amidase domain